MTQNLITFHSKPNYVGKVLALNPEKTQKYQCGGFWLGPARPIAIVPPEAQMEQIHLAIQDGRLIEVSSDAIKTENASASIVKDLGEVGFETFVVVREIDGRKFHAFVTPKDKEQESEIRKQIKETGKIDLSKFPELEKEKKEIAPYLSGIVITDLEPNE